MSTHAFFSSCPAKTYYRMEFSNLLEYAKVNRQDGTFNDVIIHADDFSTGANRMVLSCYSTFFENLFNSEIKNEYQLPIEQIHGDARAVKYIIDYMYEGNITITCMKTTSQYVLNILAAADFLKLDDVKSFCFNFLEEHISLDYWYAGLFAAKFYKCDRLQKYTFQFMADHLWEITETDDFKHITKDDLTSFVMILKESDTVYCELAIAWTKQNEVERKALLADLFQMIDFKKLPIEALQNLFKETLIHNDTVCENAVRCELFNRREMQECRNKEL